MLRGFVMFVPMILLMQVWTFRCLMILLLLDYTHVIIKKVTLVSANRVT